VGGQHHGPALGEPGEQGAEADALLGVEAGGRLVDDEQLRVVEQGLGDADAAAHPTGVPAQLAASGVAEVDQLQQLADPPAPGAPVVEALQQRDIVE